MKNLLILGATGSIGGSVLDVVRANPGEFRVAGLAAKRAGDKLAALSREFPGADIAVLEESGGNISPRGRTYRGGNAAETLARECAAEICVAGISGTAGLRPTFAAAERGMRILLANKEVLVSAGALFLAAAKKSGAEVLPLDSEHAALWQCLEGRDRSAVTKIWITASGGPFRTRSQERMRAVTPADAVKHPKWNMGAKISVDSATLANKALEVVEAHMLFGFAVDAIGVLVHPQSAVHGIAEFADGSQLAHMGICDMRQPASCMLFYPERRATALPRLDLLRLGRLDFEAPDAERFPLLGLGVDAAKRGGAFPALYNAANETAVELFLAGKLSFPDIAAAVAAALRKCAAAAAPASLDDVAAVHREASRHVCDFAIRNPL